ncbi:hypothetical protein BDZ89DRAFT_1172025 [Hymenopellis radicata]|nr:hypothetical protein BDZ89DRAFT_1172025 [Hymenopellis radicata]
MPLSSPIATIPVDQDESLISVGLFQVTRHFVLIGVEAHDHMSTEELTLRPGASDIKVWELQAAEKEWRALNFPLQEKEEILAFKLDERSRLLAVLTWFDEPEKADIRMQLHLVNFDTLHPIQTPVNLVVPWKVEDCREESPKAFIDIYGDLVGICVHELISRSNLRVYNWKSGSQLLNRICSRADEGFSFAFVSDRTVAVANRKLGAIDLVPLSNTPSTHTHRLQVSASILPKSPSSLSLSSASFGNSDLLVFKFGAPFGQQVHLVAARDAILQYSAEVEPPFPSLSIHQLVDDRVDIPWAQWGSIVTVFSNDTLQSDTFMVDATWFVAKTAAEGGHRFMVHDIVADDKVVLDAILDYQDVVVQSDCKRIMGLKSYEYGDGNRCFESIDIYTLE